MNFHAYETSKLNGKNRIAAIHRLADTKQYPFAQHYVVSLWDHLRVAPPWVVGGGILSFPHTRVIPTHSCQSGNPNLTKRSTVNYYPGSLFT